MQVIIFVKFRRNDHALEDAVDNKFDSLALLNKRSIDLNR